MKQSTFYYLLRRGAFGGGGKYTPEYQAVLDYSTSRGWDLPPEGQQVLQNALLVSLKESGAWAKMDKFYLFTGEGSRDFYRIDWVNPTNSTLALNGNTSATLNWTKNEGYYTDGASYLNTRYNPTNDGVNASLNSITMGLYEFNVGSARSTMAGSNDGTNDISLIPSLAGTTFVALNDALPNGFSPRPNYQKGLYMSTRKANDTIYFFDTDGFEYSAAVASTALNAQDISILKYGDSTFSSTDARVGAFFIGAEMYSEKADIYTAIDTYYADLAQWVIDNPSAPTFEGLLDTYSGAAVAYSLRKLDSTYAGAAIEVTADGSTFIDIGFDIDGNLDVGQFPTGNNLYVSKWYDQSGNGNDAVQSAFASMPKIYDAVTGVVLDGTTPAIYYDGAGDELAITQENFGATFMVNVVYNSVRTSSEDYVLHGDGGASRFRLYDYQALIYVNSATYAFAHNNNFGTKWLWTIEADSANNLMTYRDGVAAGSPQAIPGTDNFFLQEVGRGATRPVNGYMSEVIVYATDQSANRNGIETNISNYWQ